VSVKEAAALLGISTITVYRGVEAGRIPHVRLKGRVLFDTQRLDQFAKENAVEPKVLA
jgi:excisionase family DNA binding protein